MEAGWRDLRARVSARTVHAPGLFSLFCDAPELASAVTAGEFAMIGIDGRSRPYLRRAFSVADADRGRGTVEFPPYLKALADAGFAGTVSIELEYSPQPDKIVDWVREAYTATDRLMSDLAIRS